MTSSPISRRGEIRFPPESSPRRALRRKVTLEIDRDLARELGLVLGRDPDDELVPLLETGVLEIALDHETVVAGHEAFVRPDPERGVRGGKKSPSAGNR